MTVLEELWYGNINPHETFLNDDRYYKKLLSLIGKNRDLLADTLTERQKEILDNYDATINEMNSIAEQTAFRFGFSLGVKISTESIAIKSTVEDRYS